MCGASRPAALAPRGTALAALGAPGGRAVGVAAETAIGHDLHFGQQRGQRAGGGRLGGAALAADQHAADARVDGIQHQAAPHALLSDNRGEGEDDGHVAALWRHYTAPGCAVAGDGCQGICSPL